MSADNLIRIKQKKNGLYQVRHEFASSLAHAMCDIEPTEDELLLEVVADDIDGYDNALKVAQKFEQALYEEGGEVEYGIVDDNFKK